MQAVPTSTSNLLTVLMDTSARRLVDRKLIPSENIPRIWARFSIDSLFMNSDYQLIMLLSSTKFSLAYIANFVLAKYKSMRYKKHEARLKVLFADQQLALIETDQAGCTQLPVGVIKSARRKLVVLRAAVDDRSLRNWKSLNYEKLKGNRSGQHSIRLNDQYRFYFRVDRETQPWTITILTLEDGHL